MCLQAIRSRFDFPQPKAPGRRKAYKVITADRKASYYPGKLTYLPRSVHEERIENIERHAGRQGEIHVGFHVYLTLERAKEEHAQFPDEMIIEVHVKPEDWIADGQARGIRGKLKATQAVYAKIRVGRIVQRPKRER